MRIGIYLDLRNPPEWRRPWPDFYRQNLDLAVQAEGWGADSVWLSEHHFFEDGYLPQPLTFAAAVAARTRRIRIGTAVVLAPLRPALQIAEEAAVVDLISGGRLDLGLGAGYAHDEFEAFGADRSLRFTTTDRRVREVRELLEGGKVTPPPVQSPFPVWLGYNGPQGARRAGRLGCGLLSINPASVTPYTEGLAEGGHPPTKARMAGVVWMVVADDPDEAHERLLPHLAWQLNTYQAARVAGTGETPSPLDRGDTAGTAHNLRHHPPAGGAYPRGRHRVSTLAGRGHADGGGLLLGQHRRHARRLGPPPRRVVVHHRP